MNQNFVIVTLVAATILLTAHSDAQAQVYFYPSNTVRTVPQTRGIVGAPTRVYSNNGIRYQSQRPIFGSPPRYSNGTLYFQPSLTNIPRQSTFFRTQPTPYSYGNGTLYQGYYGNADAWNQPSTTYQSNYGNGFYYVTPR